MEVGTEVDHSDVKIKTEPEENPPFYSVNANLINPMVKTEDDSQCWVPSIDSMPIKQDSELDIPLDDNQIRDILYEGNKLTCYHCNRSRTSLRGLRHHIRRRHKLLLKGHDVLEKAFQQCSHCKYSTIESANLKRHMCAHKEKKPHQCSNCDDSATQSSQLKINIMSAHTNEKRFQCLHSGKKLYWRDQRSMSEEERKRQRREAATERRRKRREDPILKEVDKENERRRYLRRVENGKIKLVGDMSTREKRQKRKQWRLNTKNHRVRKAALENLETPPGTPLSEGTVIFSNED